MDHCDGGELTMGEGKIEIKISKRTGEFRVEGFDFEGGECIHNIEELQNRLGLKTISEELKPEYVHTVEVIRAKQ